MQSVTRLIMRLVEMVSPNETNKVGILLQGFMLSHLNRYSNVRRQLRPKSVNALLALFESRPRSADIVSIECQAGWLVYLTDFSPGRYLKIA